MNDIKGIIFDFNGTMIFDGKLQEQAWRQYLGEKTGREITDEEFHRYVHGRNADATFAYFIGRGLTKNEIGELAEEKEQICRRLYLEQPEVFRLADGLPEFLDLLKTKRVPMTIATASGWGNVRFYFDHLPLDRWFDIKKVAYDDGTVQGKPEPDLYLKAARHIGVPPEQCMVFEDAVAGIAAAQRAGAGCIVGVASMLYEKQLRAAGDLASIISDYNNAATLLE